jgi:hypothetical protein
MNRERETNGEGRVLDMVFHNKSVTRMGTKRGAIM